MDIRERFENALAELGPGAKPAKRKKARRRGPIRPRPDKSEREISRKAVYRQCKKKTRYRSAHEARLTANMCEAQRGTPLRVYPCPICGGWHITSSAGRGAK